MKVLRKVLKSKLFYLLLVLGVFVIPILKFNLHAQEDDDYVNYSNKNLAAPYLEDKEYLGDGIYKLYNDNGITIEYDVYSSITEINGTATSAISYYFVIFSNTLDEYRTISVRYVSGTVVSGNNEIGIYDSGTGVGIVITNNNYLSPLLSQSKNNVNQLVIYIPSGAVLTNYQFKLQLEKGDTATPYTVPLQPYLWHEKRLSYESGYDGGFDDGHDEGFYFGIDSGYTNGYDDGYDVGFDNGYDLGYDDGNDHGYYLGYNVARYEYGILINGEWVSAVDYG